MECGVLSKEEKSEERNEGRDLLRQRSSGRSDAGTKGARNCPGRDVTSMMQQGGRRNGFADLYDYDIMRIRNSKKHDELGQVLKAH